MILGKHINRYYLRYAPMLLLGLIALMGVDYLQLEIPKLYGAVIDGMKAGMVTLEDGTQIPFDMAYVLDSICMPMVKIILAMVFGRFLWRVCFFSAGIRAEADLRARMFSHCKDLSREYYQVNKVGDLMSLFTNDLDTIQESFSWGPNYTFLENDFRDGISHADTMDLHRRDVPGFDVREFYAQLVSDLRQRGL